MAAANAAQAQWERMDPADQALISAYARGINAFRGAGRRFEFLGEVNGVTIADDYAHHPTELEATLRAAWRRASMRRSTKRSMK